jgi:hypothetical protein
MVHWALGRQNQMINAEDAGEQREIDTLSDLDFLLPRVRVSVRTNDYY